MSVLVKYHYSTANFRVAVNIREATYKDNGEEELKTLWTNPEFNQNTSAVTTRWLKTLLSDPLTHFAVLAFVLFYFLPLGSPEEDIESQRYSLTFEQFLQYRAQRFDTDILAQTEADLEATVLESLREEYQREETLVREAARIGLDRGDYIIRRRLADKMDFALRARLTVDEPKKPDLLAFYQQNSRDYLQPAHVSFIHLFFSAQDGAWEQALSRAQSVADEITASQAPAESWIGRGDRYPYGHQFSQRIQDTVVASFGDSFAQQLFEADLASWSIPMRSERGYHLAFLRARSAKQIPPFESMEDIVRFDYKKAQKDVLVEAAIKEISNTHDEE